ncbi:four helix bundle protein [Candidatus Uhrbacteria bacterium]|nr:four helix bundle protein [Candidatus Uhrbacteria bacterium]
MKHPPPVRSTILSRLLTTYNQWRIVQNDLPKKSRYTIGNKIDQLFTDVLESIFVANYLPPSQKLPYVEQAVRRLDLLKFFLQVAWEIKDIDNKKYINLSESLSEVGRMVGSWRNNLKAAKEKTPTKSVEE